MILWRVTKILARAKEMETGRTKEGNKSKGGGGDEAKDKVQSMSTNGKQKQQHSNRKEKQKAHQITRIR